MICNIFFLMFSFKVREESHLDEQIFHSLTQVMTVCYIESWQVIFRLIWEGEWLLDSSIHSVTQHIKHHHLFRPAPFDAENTRSLSAGFYLVHKVRHPEPLSVGSTGLFKHLPSPLSEWKKKPISTVWWEKSGGNHRLGCINAWKWWEIPCLFSVVFVRFMKQQQYFPIFSGKLGFKNPNQKEHLPYRTSGCFFFTFRHEIIKSQKNWSLLNDAGSVSVL